ncbi:MAG: peptidase M61, partial [Ramlibacter sp.]
VVPHDWATFLRTRVNGHGPGAPLDGLARAGWKLVYTDTPTDYIKGADDRNKVTDLSYSVGFTVSSEGNIRNVIWDGPGFRAGLAANTSIVAVNNRVYKPELLKNAIKAAKDSKEPIQLLVRKGNVLRTVAIDYHGGLRYPRLERIPGAKDRLEGIYSALK